MIASAIQSTGLNLMPGVDLFVHAVQGTRSSVLIDTGIAPMRQALLELCDRVGKPEWVLLSHVHADHIGCNRAVQAATGARFAVGGCVEWIENLETHYREFCLTDTLGDPGGQRAEILELMDGPVRVDRVFHDGERFDLGDLELEVVTLPGHKLEEVGFWVADQHSLILGDVLLALAAPFFHGFETSLGFHASLDRLEALLETHRVEHIFSAHHAPMNAGEARARIECTRTFLNDVYTSTLEAATGVTFETLWHEVSAKLGKNPEFRGYAMLRAQVRELLEAGQLSQVGERLARV